MDLNGYEKKCLGKTLANHGTSAKLGFLFVLYLSNDICSLGALELTQS